MLMFFPYQSMILEFGYPTTSFLGTCDQSEDDYFDFKNRFIIRKEF